MSTPQYAIPNLLRNWPWTRHLSKYYADVKNESSAWVESLHPFGPDGQKSFNDCNFSEILPLSRLFCFFFFLWLKFTCPQVCLHASHTLTEAKASFFKPSQAVFKYLISYISIYIYTRIRSCRLRFDESFFCIRRIY